MLSVDGVSHRYVLIVNLWKSINEALEAYGMLLTDEEARFLDDLESSKPSSLSGDDLFLATGVIGGVGSLDSDALLFPEEPV